MALLIPVLRENHASLVKALNRVAPYDWCIQGKIHVFPIDDPQSENVADDVSEFCQDNSIQHILLPKRLHCGELALQEAGYTVLMGPGISELLRGHGLRNQLRALQLDWRSEVVARLVHYSHGPVGEIEIETWLGQFERLGIQRAIGEHLLQLLDVVPLAELGGSLCTDSDFYGADLIIGFNNDKWGKSWAPVSNLIRKRCPSASLLPITQAIQAAEYPRVLRLVEDGLFSGTEIRAVFDSLRGARPPFRSQKVPMLPDPGILSRAPTALHFGVVCDFGEAVLRQYLSSNSLPNVQVILNGAARKIRVLRPAEPRQFQNDAPQAGYSDNGRLNQDQVLSRVVPFAFQDDKGWWDSGILLTAKTFCENVGEQLWRSYITKKPNFESKAWPDARIRRCALGMDGLGLTFAFPHSVPRATLPVFWARARVTVRGTSINWIPLFPNADI